MRIGNKFLIESSPFRFLVDRHFHFRFARSVKHIDPDLGGSGLSGGHDIRYIDSHLVVGRMTRSLEIQQVSIWFECHDRISIRRTVAHGGMRDAAIVFRPGPPSTANRYVDNVMMVLVAVETILLA